MSRRTVAGLLAVTLLGVLVFAASRVPVPYVTMGPGPTVDVLGEQGGRPVLRVEGERTYPTDGELRLTTVSVTRAESRISLAQALGAWLRPDVDVVPYEAVYPEQSTDAQERAESAAQMVSSQDTAVAVALAELGREVPTFVEVVEVAGDGPSQGRLRVGDRVLAVEGRRISEVGELLGEVDAATPGDRVALQVRRGDRTVDVEITTDEAPEDPRQARLGVTVTLTHDFPVDVDLRVDESIGGPSAGLIFALSVYDALTPGSLTGGAAIAGTGTIAPDGSVGPIGGVRQKIAGAEEAGAELFLVPAANCPAATTARPDGLRLVRADTMHDVVDALTTYADDPTADLPRCTS